MLQTGFEWNIRERESGSAHRRWFRNPFHKMFYCFASNMNEFDSMYIRICIIGTIIADCGGHKPFRLQHFATCMQTIVQCGLYSHSTRIHGKLIDAGFPWIYQFVNVRARVLCTNINCCVITKYTQIGLNHWNWWQTNCVVRVCVHCLCSLEFCNCRYFGDNLKITTHFKREVLLCLSSQM